MKKLPTTRQEAKRLGSIHYDTEQLCRRGHLSPRFTSIGKCMACAREDTMQLYTHTTTKRRAYNDHKSFVEEANRVHGGLYGYPATGYINAHTAIDIMCYKHGVFKMSPTNHVQGKGCSVCGGVRGAAKQTKSVETFIAEATKLWEGRFDYSKVEYRGARVLVKLVCTKHPNVDINQTPDSHLSKGDPCTKCNHMKSAPEEAVAKYISVYAPIIHRDKTQIKPKELDIYIPSANLAVEFHGMFSHSHFSAEDEAKNKHKSYDKYRICAASGIRLITIYQTEWEQRRPQVKRLLKNALGKSKGRVMARKCSLAEVSHAEAKEFYNKYHPQGGDGMGIHYGLYWNTKLVACMRFSLGPNDRGSAKVRDWTLSRYATRVTVVGGASKLFKAFILDKSPDVVKSFSDNRYFSGGMYEQLGFELDKELPPDYQVWSQKLGLLPKTHYQRRAIQKRLNEHGKAVTYNHLEDARTEKEMTYLMGAGRIYDCGKRKWVWTNC